MTDEDITKALRALTAAEAGANVSLDYVEMANATLWPNLSEMPSERLDLLLEGEPLLRRFEHLIQSLYQCNREILEIAQKMEAQR